MPRSPRLLLVVVLLVSSTLLTAVAAAGELPPGFTDGVPMGDPGQSSGPSQDQRSASTAAQTVRYFGEGAYASVRAAVAAVSRPCSISDDGLTALVLAPVFKESSAATTASTAPAPMTLSRYDEWSGTFSTASNSDANYGLYAFRDPNTAYQRAYWHPGLGIWQYDSAGLGAPLTTIEAMDVQEVVADVARIMSGRYCSATGDAQNKRYEAWRPWGFPCTLCQGFFDEMYGSTPKFANLELVPGISRLGGVVQRTCVLQGVGGTLPCWYVEPRVGVIEGATAWATLSPDGGSGPTVAPAPLSHPFYVLDRGTTEERHWLREDTGYGVDIRASRVIGKNARPRSNQTGSGLTWATGTGLCDLDTGHGVCAPVAPAGINTATVTVNGSYVPVALDADGDGRGDVLWYGPGGPDYLWIGSGSGVFSSSRVSIGSGYDDLLSGDIDGDGDDDVVFYDRESGLSYLWRATGTGAFTSSRLYPGAGHRPFLLDLDADGAQEVFWYGPGSVSDAVWDWTGGQFASSARSVSGTYTPLVGDFDGNGRDDVFWYAPGGNPDYGWLHKTAGGWLSVAYAVDGTYRVAVGDFDGDDKDDVLWHGPGSNPDSTWFGGGAGQFVSAGFAVSGSYTPIAIDLHGSGRELIIWYAPGAAKDSMWTWAANRTYSSTALELPSTQVALVGPFSVGGADGILWYGPGAVADRIWYR